MLDIKRGVHTEDSTHTNIYIYNTPPNLGLLVAVFVRWRAHGHFKREHGGAAQEHDGARGNMERAQGKFAAYMQVEFTSEGFHSRR